MRRLLITLLLSASAYATTPVTGNLADLSGTAVASKSKVRLWLRGCGGNQPRVTGTAIIAPTNGNSFYFDLVPNGSGAIAGTVYSNDVNVSCGGQAGVTWYGMQVFVNGAPGPETCLNARDGVTLNLNSATPCSTNPVVPTPTGDNTYARLDGGNQPFTGAVTVPSLNGVCKLEKQTGADFGAKFAAAQANSACLVIDATGVTGSQTAASTLTFTRAVTLWHGAYTLTLNGNPGVNMNAVGASMVGLGRNQTILTAGANNDLIQLNAGAEILDNLELEGAGKASNILIHNVTSLGAKLNRIYANDSGGASLQIEAGAGTFIDVTNSLLQPTSSSQPAIVVNGTDGCGGGSAIPKHFVNISTGGRPIDIQGANSFYLANSDISGVTMTSAACKALFSGNRIRNVAGLTLSGVNNTFVGNIFGGTVTLDSTFSFGVYAGNIDGGLTNTGGTSNIVSSDSYGYAGTTYRVPTAGNTLGNTLTNDTAGGFLFTTNAGKTIQLNNTNGHIFIPANALFSVNASADATYGKTATPSLYATITNCAAVGTAASPSVASCSSAAAGHFSCATNATGATCTVNTTAVTAGSEILVFESDTAATGTALGVTCNTSTNVLPTSRLLASSVAGTSFTINLGTVTTNPACFSYLIMN